MRTRGGLAATLAAAALVITACGGGSTPQAKRSSPSPTVTVSSPSPSTSQTAQPSAEVAIVDNSYDPAEVTVASGGTVVWNHAGTAAHSVTADDGSFDSSPQCNTTVGLSQCMQTGQTFAHLFNTPGRFAYHCRIHGTLMAGVVVLT